LKVHRPSLFFVLAFPFFSLLARNNSVAGPFFCSSALKGVHFFASFYWLMVCWLASQCTSIGSSMSLIFEQPVIDYRSRFNRSK
jgi:hypothetical protein